MATGAFRCKDCHMTFNSQSLLTKHKSKFCVGGTGDPDDLLLRRGLRSADDSPRHYSPDFDRVGKIQNLLGQNCIILKCKLAQFTSLKSKYQLELLSFFYRKKQWYPNFWYSSSLKQFFNT